jgi:hypothetical protein
MGVREAVGSLNSLNFRRASCSEELSISKRASAFVADICVLVQHDRAHKHHNSYTANAKETRRRRTINHNHPQ